jgi:hypothetical protein
MPTLTQFSGWRGARQTIAGARKNLYCEGGEGDSGEIEEIEALGPFNGIGDKGAHIPEGIDSQDHVSHDLNPVPGD